MADVAWRTPPPNKKGNSDERLSPWVKVWIMQGNDCVVGAIGEGTSKSVSANWNSPFEDDSVGSKFSKTGGIIQQELTDGKTSITRLASTQVWNGSQPHKFSINLSLYARSDPFNEVEGAIALLEQMQAPSLEEKLPVGVDDIFSAPRVGRVPLTVTVNVGRSIIYPDCVIESLSVPVDGPRSPEGYLLSAEVQLEIATKKLLNRTQIS